MNRALWWMCVVSVLGFAGCARWPDDQVAETERRGDIVRNALARYKEEKGVFPQAVQELLPKFLDDIPQPTVGKKRWEYKMYPAGGGDYWLTVSVRFELWQPLLQASAKEPWFFDTK
jgi:hypothetical protein